MLRLILLLALLIPSASSIGAAGPSPPAKVRLPKEAGLYVEGDVVLVVKSLPFKVVSSEPADLYFWRIPLGWKATENGPTLTVTEAPQGTYTVSVQTLKIDWDTRKTIAKTFAQEVNIGKVSPPVPPIPPVPPTPDPPVPPVPPPVALPKVLIIEESSERTKLPASQQMVILGKPMRDWLNAKCAPDPATDSGKGWAIWDKDVDASGASKFYQDALKQPRTSVPWVVVGDDTTISYSGALPTTTSATIALLSKHIATTPRYRKAS